MTDLVKSANAAAKETAQSMAVGLVQSALSESWDSRIANKLGVKFNAVSSNFELRGDTDSEVQAAEYGTQQTSPAPAIRKFLNRTSQYESEFIGRLSSKVGFEL